MRHTKRPLTQRTWTTRDARGCEFRVTATITRDGEYGRVIERRYEGLGIVAESLAELKRRVSEIE